MSKTPARPGSRWNEGKERYPSTDPRKHLVTALQKARTAEGWRNGARVTKRA